MPFVLFLLLWLRQTALYPLAFLHHHTFQAFHLLIQVKDSLYNGPELVSAYVS